MFTDDEELSIVMILGTTPSLLDAHLISLGNDHVTRVEDAVREEIAIWDAGASTKFTKLHPRESNKGVETFPEAARSSVKANVARLLEWPYSYSVASMGTLQIG